MVIVEIDILIFSIVLMVFLAYFICRYFSKDKYSRVLFLRIVLSVLLVLIVDLLTFFSNGNNSEYGRVLNRLLINVSYIIYPLPIMCWVYYLQYKLFGSMRSARNALWLVTGPYFVALILLVINWSTGLLFFFDSMNQFYKGQYYLFLELLVYTPIFAYGVYLFINSKKVKSGILLTIALLFAIPAASVFVQHHYNFITLNWPSIALVTILSFILIETDELRRDHLTGLYTKGFFDKQLKTLLGRKISLALLMIDIDDFKDINDTFGHPVGDQALKVAASILTSNLKHDDLVFRVGGDEFIILLQNVTPDALDKVIDRLRGELSIYNKKGLVPYTLSMSMGGCYVGKSDNYTYQQLIRKVDKKLYCDKKSKGERNEL